MVETHLYHTYFRPCGEQQRPGVRAGLHDQLGRLQGRSVPGRHHHPLRRSRQRQRHGAAPLSGTQCQTLLAIVTKYGFLINECALLHETLLRCRKQNSIVISHY